MLTLLSVAFVVSTVTGCKRTPREAEAKAQSVEPAPVDPAPAGPPATLVEAPDSHVDGTEAVEKPEPPAPKAEALPPITKVANPRKMAVPVPDAQLKPAAERTARHIDVLPTRVKPRVVKTADLPEDAHSDLEVLSSTAAQNVVKRAPQGQATDFAEGAVWAWVRVKNPGDASRVRMIWKHEGEVRSRVDLKVGTSGGWRTWSRKTMATADSGDWTVEVHAPDGELLDSIEFTVTPDSWADRRQ